MKTFLREDAFRSNYLFAHLEEGLDYPGVGMVSVKVGDKEDVALLKDPGSCFIGDGEAIITS